MTAKIFDLLFHVFFLFYILLSFWDLQGKWRRRGSLYSRANIAEALARLQYLKRDDDPADEDPFVQADLFISTIEGINSERLESFE